MISGFWQQEIEFREKWDYPPFTHMVLIHVRSPYQTRATFSAETLARSLREVLPTGVWMSEPAPAPLEKSRGKLPHPPDAARPRHRAAEPATAGGYRKAHIPEDGIVNVDVDPYQLLWAVGAQFYAWLSRARSHRCMGISKRW